MNSSYGSSGQGSKGIYLSVSDRATTPLGGQACGPRVDSFRAASFDKSTAAQGARCAAYSTYFSQSGEQPNAVVRPDRGPRQAERDESSLRSRSYAIRSQVLQTLREIDRLAEAGEGESIERAALGQDVRNSLRELWRLRVAREDGWGVVLNFLQSAISAVPPEAMRHGQLLALRAVIADHIGGGAVCDDDVMDVKRILRAAGLDPWAGLELRAGEDGQAYGAR